MTGTGACWLVARTGHVAAVPPSSQMNSRRPKQAIAVPPIGQSAIEVPESLVAGESQADARFGNAREVPTLRAVPTRDIPTNGRRRTSPAARSHALVEHGMLAEGRMNVPRQRGERCHEMLCLRFGVR